MRRATVMASGKGIPVGGTEGAGGGQARFQAVPPEQTGITFINPLDERAIAANRVLSGGCGVALGDFDNDGLTDIFLCSLNSHKPSTRIWAG